MSDFSHLDYWKAITLYGLNVATYKPALAKVLIKASSEGLSEIKWDDLSKRFFLEYKARLEKTGMPQHNTIGRITKLEKAVKLFNLGVNDEDASISFVSKEGFNDVVPRFHSIGQDSKFAENYFYEIQFGKKLILKENLLEIVSNNKSNLDQEIESRWSLLEGAFKINHSDINLSLVNNIRDIYLRSASKRTNLTKNIPFLKAYQGDVCFYCGEEMNRMDVDHVLPYQVVQHNEIWNLVLAHDHCNQMKKDLLVGKHFIQKLIKRNENIMGSNHPWKSKIQQMLGKTPTQRASKLNYHYNNVEIVLNNNYWGGSKTYNPEKDPFYRRLITKLNNR